ncbi:MAG: PorV/PorQ family protein [Chitinophagaceae bacterium]|jgi:hypothetical protein|uniref:PorV/PorQ family protein n=1 Tax=Sediminibacterium sp. TaxID=1917865 RepID=UPI001BBE58FC|nr:PorV/PorQ family protein [Sediminibacterium sp.]MBS4065735.1 PorV/PorQ family protein [Chitinophagaceae bacterium]MDZ4070641.1 PorV/PorQ family protein [Sediminibacterium sp.]
MRWLLILLLVPGHIYAQLSTHSRGAAMGDAGIASATGNQQLGYNVGKTVFTNYLHQTSVSYLPWMRHLFQDTKFIRVDYLTTTGESTTLGFAVNYLDFGNLTTRDNYGASLAIYRNVAYNIGGTVGVRLSSSSGIGATLRLLGARSFEAGGALNRYGVSADLQYYHAIGKFSLGMVVNNLGNDLWQVGETGVGFAYTDQDEMKAWSVALDIRKPLKGSFASSRYSLGAEMGFAESFFLRTGLSLEHQDYGNRKYGSLGAGYKGFVEDQSWGIDLHYIIPFGIKAALAPMQQAYGLTLYLNIGSFQ